MKKILAAICLACMLVGFAGVTVKSIDPPLPGISAIDPPLPMPWSVGEDQI